ncbi:hypothetical protein [Kitasatospora albolonga]|uniref:hypothetical protein n=1 Tax=Kitasatospora albolonga TaxID=68173 RepID=UPI001ABFB867
MATRRLHLARHGEADAFGELTGTGHRQADLLGERLAGLPVDTVCGTRCCPAPPRAPGRPQSTCWACR